MYAKMAITRPYTEAGLSCALSFFTWSICTYVRYATSIPFVVQIITTCEAVYWMKNALTATAFFDHSARICFWQFIGMRLFMSLKTCWFWWYIFIWTFYDILWFVCLSNCFVICHLFNNFIHLFRWFSYFNHRIGIQFFFSSESIEILDENIRESFV